jgi:hypothetical protein
MVNALFKGDLAEVSFGKEVGLTAVGTGDATGFAFTSSGNTATLTLGSASSNYWKALIPDNILVGCVLRFAESSTGNLLSDNYATTRRAFYITANDTTAGTITIQPSMASTNGNAATTGSFTIDSFQCPTVDTGMTDSANNQRVLSDQFVGLLNEFALPEPEIDVRKQHIIGMGRDVNIITSGRETLAGGSFQLNAHSLRWLKYALGGHTAKSNGSYSTTVAATDTISEAPFNIVNAVTAVGRAELQSASGTANSYSAIATNGTVITNLDAAIGTSALGTNCLIGASVASTTGATSTLAANTMFSVTSGTAAGVLKLNNSGTTVYASYTSMSGGGTNLTINGIADIDTGAAALALVAYKCLVLMPPLAGACAIGDVRLNVGATLRALFSVGDYIQVIDKDTHQIPGQDGTPPTIFKHELRRVVAVEGAYVYVDEPMTFAHAITSCGIDRLRYQADASLGSPNIVATTRELQNGVTHTIFGHTQLPSFTVEQSFRTTDATPGGEQLLRLYSGCKMESATMSADTEGELKIEGEYEASRHYTDTGGMFNPHRMFDNTANTSVNRKVSGIAVDGEKPYLFQNISIQAFGKPILRATEFSVQVTNANTARWYIRGYEGASADTDQVQNGGTQTPLDITESTREYTFTFKALVEDDLLWEQLRTRKHHQNTNDITFSLTKSGSASTRQNATITIEDYTITKAEHQIPSDKGPVTADVELIVRHMKVTETNPYFIM